MKVNTFEQKLLIELIPEDIRKKIATLPVVESGYGAGSGFAAVQRWTHDPPTTFLNALDELEHYRERLRRCHIVFLDGSRLVMDRHQFHSFHPSVRMRRKHAARIGQDGIIRERFRFSDYEGRSILSHPIYSQRPGKYISPLTRPPNQSVRW